MRKKMHTLTVMAVMICLGIIFSAAKQPSMTKAQLGRKLFFDPILSEDQSISCASCHKPQFAFADTMAFSRGVHGRSGLRNTPSAMNVAARESLFWDGRAPSLEAQALIPIANPVEMNLPTDSAVARLGRSKTYSVLFRRIFKAAPNRENLGAAIAAFERSLETGNTPNDRWLADKPGGLSKSQVRGRDIFFGKALCSECHFTPDFTGDEMRGIGLFDGIRHKDSGRYAVSGKWEDIGRFKVPGLRNVAVTAPYMHDGSFKSLREVIDYYDDPAAVLPHGLNRDSLLQKPLHLSESEKQDLEAFLHGLTDDRFQKAVRSRRG